MTKPRLPDLFTKLKNVYREHRSLIIAVDFDDTLYDWKNKGWDNDYVVNLVKRARVALNAQLILFTCREGDLLNEALEYCDLVGIKLDYVNESPKYGSRKPFYNVLLDDKACLPECCEVLERLINEVNPPSN